MSPRISCPYRCLRHVRTRYLKYLRDHLKCPFDMFGRMMPSLCRFLSITVIYPQCHFYILPFHTHLSRSPFDESSKSFALRKLRKFLIVPRQLYEYTILCIIKTQTYNRYALQGYDHLRPYRKGRHMNTRNIFLNGIVGAVLLISLVGCYSSRPEDIAYFKRPDIENVSTDKYVLQPADTVEVQASQIPELHQQAQQIRPDGKITFENLGDIPAAGKTPAELAELIYQEVIKLYALTGDHPIDVRITDYRSNVYYVFGQVYFQGRMESTGRVTVLDALANARMSNLAEKKKVQIVRPSANLNDRPKIFEFNFSEMAVHGNASKNVLLEDGDIVFVPPTWLAAIGLTVEQLVSPIGRAFSTVNIVQGPPERRD